MEHARGMFVHLDHDDIRAGLARDAGELIGRVPDGRVQNHAIPAMRDGGVAVDLQFPPSRLHEGERLALGGLCGFVHQMSKRLGLDDVNDVQLRVVDGAYEVGRPCEDVLADVTQIDADDDHQVTPTFTAVCFNHEASLGNRAARRSGPVSA